jgi:hypothetical protein
MNMTEVVELCRELYVKGEPGPYGVTFSWYFDAGCSPRASTTVHYRIENGSGIAGRGYAWNVYELPAGPTLGPKVTTKRCAGRSSRPSQKVLDHRTAKGSRFTRDGIRSG